MWWYRDFYPPRSRPRQAKGGIKAQTRSGSFGKNWWAKRWVEVLESFNLGARLGRGRTYARKGQVLSVDVGKGEVKAKVQGSRATPYKVSIQVAPLSDQEWEKVMATLSTQALFVAKLLAGEMPNEIEEVFKKAKLSLFPAKRKDLVTDCSCPDWSNPCKHIAAVYYLLGEEFDRDPFLIFRLRGLDREEFLKRLGEASPGAAGEEGMEPGEGLPPEPLVADPASYWHVGEVPAEVLGEVEPPRVSGAWPQRLGNFPFWRGEENLLGALVPIYRDAAQRGRLAFLGEVGTAGEADEEPGRKAGGGRRGRKK
jgi:uncharacterized Zn finger protein